MSNNNYSDATADSNCTALEEDEQLEKWYAIYVPLMIGACVLTFLMNATVLAAFPFITNLSKVGPGGGRKVESSAWKVISPTPRHSRRNTSRRRKGEEDVLGACWPVDGAVPGAARKLAVFLPPLAHNPLLPGRDGAKVGAESKAATLINQVRQSGDAESSGRGKSESHTQVYFFFHSLRLSYGVAQYKADT